MFIEFVLFKLVVAFSFLVARVIKNTRTATTSGQYSPVRPSRSGSKRLIILNIKYFPSPENGPKIFFCVFQNSKYIFIYFFNPLRVYFSPRFPGPSI